MIAACRYFIDFALLAENIGVVVCRCIYRVDFISDYLYGLYRLGRQMRLGTRFTERKQKSVFRRKYGK